MKEIHFNDIADKIAQMCIDAACNLDEDILSALDRSIEIEKSLLGLEVLKQLKENAKIAKDEGLPVCQDTGMSLFFVELGEDVRIKGGLLNDAITKSPVAGLVFVLIDELIFFQPGHHRAKSGADFFNRMALALF